MVPHTGSGASARLSAGGEERSAKARCIGDAGDGPSSFPCSPGSRSVIWLPSPLQASIHQARGRDPERRGRQTNTAQGPKARGCGEDDHCLAWDHVVWPFPRVAQRDTLLKRSGSGPCFGACRAGILKQSFFYMTSKQTRWSAWRVM
jgi:hypothetical protein